MSNGIIAVDVDSVVAELGPAWLGRYNKDYNDTLTSKDILSWDTHLYVKPECGLKIYEYLKDPTLYDDVKPIPYALECVKYLSQQYRIIYVTTSPIESFGAKYKWLKRYKFISDLSDYVECKDKSLIKADYLIDDNFNNVKQFGGVGYLFTQPWNIKFYWPFRINDWLECKNIWA